ncbi:hypothetical protein KY290_028504 [Solanum tuberosum]|uniref:NB-ARC domain-containing protein n=1 Tax=Solanum tuberosum TaxID=4113 RepID=A0ABQ7UJX7_SOLTU|nr:hypothetical protein KY290_028504 [Solanum tuberosum]
MLRFKKVLIVLDVMDDSLQLEYLAGKCDWFGDGSRVITTTRSFDLLGKHDVSYRVPELTNHEALELFSWHAFQQGAPVKDFEELSCCVLDYAKGLPLALEVLGVAGLNSRKWVESRHVGSFGELGPARRTTRRIAEVVEGTRRLAVSLLGHPLSAPLNPFCTLAFGGLTLARRKLSAIRRKAFPITYLPEFFSQSLQRARPSSPKRFGDSPTGSMNLSATVFL